MTSIPCTAHVSRSCTGIASADVATITSYHACVACAVSIAEERLSKLLTLANQAGMDAPAKACPICGTLTLVSNMRRTTGKPVCGSCFDGLDEGRRKFLPTLEEIEALS